MTEDYVIGFVSGMEVSLPFFDSVVKAVHRDRCGVISVVGGPVMHRLRNQLATLWLEAPAQRHTDRMVMVDSDIVFSLDQLDALLAHDEPIVSGVYASAIGEVVTQGCGFLSIKREVFEKLGAYPFNPIKTPEGIVSGEDVGFRFHAKHAGYATVIDHDIKVGHIKHQVIWVDAVTPAMEKVA